MNDYNKRTGWQRARAILSLNDPRWGRGEGNGQRPEEPRRPPGKNGNNGGGQGDGPPDLDEMWRDFNRRLAGLFGRKGKGPGGGLGPRPDNGHGARVGVGIVLGVLIAIYVGSGVFVIQERRGRLSDRGSLRGDLRALGGRLARGLQRMRPPGELVEQRLRGRL